jgi:formylglycine-generating enzyme required for sulfatase activity
MFPVQTGAIRKVRRAQSKVEKTTRLFTSHIYNDAEAYARWAGRRLPTEAEVEYAERGGLDRAPYAWGKEFTLGGKYMANTFQGHFPENDTGADGHIGISPVGSYKANGYGLYDMSGNVWEWTSDWYRADYYQTLAASGSLTVDPKGPADSIVPSEPGVPKRVQRGGVISLLRSVLLTLHAGWPGERRAQYGHEPSRIPAGEGRRTGHIT